MHTGNNDQVQYTVHNWKETKSNETTFVIKKIVTLDLILECFATLFSVVSIFLTGGNQPSETSQYKAIKHNCSYVI